jgi:hypothetical protein
MAGLPDGYVLDGEDAKLVTLARSARARTGATLGAAVRDGDGRTYVATDVALPSLRLDALQVAVAMAVASGAPALEMAVVVGPGAADALAGAGADAVRDAASAAGDRPPSERASAQIVAAEGDGTPVALRRV